MTPLWLCYFKLARLRYLQFSVVPFATGFLSSDNMSSATLALGIAAVIAWFVVTEYSNMVADRIEDAIDYPERTALCVRVGYERLAHVAAASAVAFLLVVSVMLALDTIAFELYLLALVCLIVTVNYSVGARVKTRQVASALVMGAYQGAFLLAGWFYGSAELVETPRDIWLSVGLLVVFGVTLAGWKDLPSLEGDSSVGYTSLYWRLFAGRHAVARARVLLGIPHAMCICLCGLNLLPARYLLVLVLAPLGWAVATVLARARTLTERRAARELGTIYLLLTMNAVLLALYPTAATLALVLAGSLSYVVLGHALHPDPAEVASSAHGAAVLKMVSPRRAREDRRSANTPSSS